MTVELNTSLPDSDWCLVESDPAIFTEMVRQFGVMDVRVDEVQSLDLIDAIATKGPVLGLVFSNKYVEEPLPENHDTVDPDANGVYFSCQVITNACASLALLGILLNTENNVELGPELRNLKEFTKDFDPVSRGLAIGNSDVIKSAHNYFASALARAEATPRHASSSKDKNTHWVEDDEYHFVSYVPVNGYVWELDGMKKSPVKLDPCTSANWVEVAKKYIQQRMNSANTIEFNILAVVHDETWLYREKLRYYEHLASATEKELSLHNDTTLYPTSPSIGFVSNIADEAPALLKSGAENPGCETSSHSDTTALSFIKRHTLSLEGQDTVDRGLEQAIQDDIARAKRNGVKARHHAACEKAQNIRDWVDFERYDTREKEETIENKRRRHDYAPFLHALFSKLHAKGQLKDMLKSS